MFEVILGLVLAAAIFTFSFIAVNLDKEKNGMLSIFFIVLTLLMVLIGLNLSADTAKTMDLNITMSNNILNQAYTPMVYVLILVISYFLIFFLDSVMKMLAKGKEAKQKSGDY